VNHVTDFVIVGGGIAGLRAAIALASIGRVLVLTKAAAAESNTGYAQGGIAAAVGAGDSPELHARDTILAGDGLCEENAVRVLVGDGPRYVHELIDWGVRFDRDAHGELGLGLEAAHSVRRVLHCGDATGREIGRALWARAASLPSVTTINHALVTALRVDAGTVSGVTFVDEHGGWHEVRAAATLLATGGAGQVFSETTNPAVATGDGIALAYHASAQVADLEFVQFHPTALNHPGAPRFLISEAVRGEGARLVNRHGEAFMTRYHASAELAPRDVVARSIMRETDRTNGRIFLDLAHLDPEHVRRRFPTIAAMCAQVGLDLARELIPVGPAAHYLMGGIVTDIDGRTSLPGLFAAGECACTGVHGANRLASNSLLEGLVFGARAAVAMTQPPRPAALSDQWRIAAPLDAGGAPSASSRIPAASESAPQQVRELMWRSAGLFRNDEGLRHAITVLDATCAEAAALQQARQSDAGWWKSFGLFTVARLIARAALRRHESRGGHFRADFPGRDDLHWKIHEIDARAD
jgi:L-aspartate oxidase